MAFNTIKSDHLMVIKEIKETTKVVCEECVKINAEWMHLRTCQNCGATLCCDSSRYKHARKHAIINDHPVISSAEKGESWIYCFKDNLTVVY